MTKDSTKIAVTAIIGICFLSSIRIALMPSLDNSVADAEKLADSRYSACIRAVEVTNKNILEMNVNASEYNRQSLVGVESCNGSLGKYQKPSEISPQRN